VRSAPSEPELETSLGLANASPADEDERHARSFFKERHERLHASVAGGKMLACADMSKAPIGAIRAFLAAMPGPDAA
jgi:hypothetical protein